MSPDKHVHIISAGDTIHTAYPAALRAMPSISRTCVIADENVYTISQDKRVEAARAATRDAVNATKEIAASLAIPFSRETAFAPVYGSARSIIIRIHRENPNARFTFDLSGGSKELCMALFALAPWLGADVYMAFDGKGPGILPLPDRDIRDMMGNVNYHTILAVLLRCRNAGNKRDEAEGVTRKYLFGQVWPYYIRSRARTPKPDEPVLQYRQGRKPANNLSPATFSSFLVNLRRAGLVEEGLSRESRKEKAYRITEKGEIAYRFFADPGANSIVKMMIDGS
jgi:hypothetical protein